MRSLSLLVGILLLIPGGYALISMVAAMWRGGGDFQDRMLVWIGCLTVSVVGLILIVDGIAARWERRR
jgi:membrane protein implicated in regulation of membrane protease activity